jgi:hypothetical protein
MLSQGLRKRAGGARTMRVPFFPIVSELGDGSLLPLRDEDRIEAEALRASRIVRDPALKHASAADLLAGWRKGHELADVARASAGALDAVELPQQALDVLPAREPRRLDPGRAVQAVDLEPRVLAEDPGRRIDRSTELCLRPSVLVVGRAFLRRVLGGFERLDRPIGQGVTQLAQLPRVLRRELRG